MSGLKQLMLGPPPMTLAVAESLTGGRLQAEVTAISGASGFFLGGITAYTLEQKRRHLGVDRARAAAVNCVSAGVAEEMACGVCALFGSDWGVATTGYAEPWPEMGAAVPHAYVAVARRGVSAGAVWSARIDGPGLDRGGMQRRVTAAAIEALLGRLREARGQ